MPNVSIRFLAILMTTVAAAQDQEPSSPRRQRPKVTVLKVGHLHPVSGPSIENGVIVISGNRIQAVGRAEDVQVPEDAEVIEHPQAHAYPGLVDAWTNAFCDDEVGNDGAATAGSRIADGLDRGHEPSWRLVEHGITTAYVGNRAENPWRGLGAIVRPKKDGFDPLPKQLAPNGDQAAVELRMTAGAAPGNPVDRWKAMRALGDAFDQLEAYAQARKDHQKAVSDYEKAFQSWIEEHRRRNVRGEGARDGARDPASQPATSQPSGPQSPGEGQRGTGEGRRGIGRRPGGERGGGERGGDGQQPGTPASRPTSQQGAGPQGPASASQPSGQGEGGKRPVYPKPPERDPGKDALLMCKNGDVPLRVEAHRREEIRALLQLRKDKALPRVVLEGGAEAASLGKELAEAGIAVVVSPVVPDPEPLPHLQAVDGSLPGALARSGVTVAISSGSQQQARYLPLFAAFAAGKGMVPEEALRAITLTPAEILGIGKLVGSLEAGKIADVLITSAPLLQADARVLRVLSGGVTQYVAGAER
jgi:imidazolonepropionase-like amidohydrolase